MWLFKVKKKNIMGMPENEQKREELYDDGNGNVNVLTKEIDSWSDFEYSLREENTLLFNKMLFERIENEHYTRAATLKMNIFQLNHYLWF
jgi:hypothetical protein